MVNILKKVKDLPSLNELTFSGMCHLTHLVNQLTL